MPPGRAETSCSCCLQVLQKQKDSILEELTRKLDELQVSVGPEHTKASLRSPHSSPAACVLQLHWDPPGALTSSLIGSTATQLLDLADLADLSSASMQ